MARLYSNENFPLRTAAVLRELGHDVLSTREAGNAGEGVPDHAVLAFAIAEERAVITLDRRDFIRLHRQMPIHCGIVVCRRMADPAAFARRIDEVLRGVGGLHGQLIKVNRA